MIWRPMSACWCARSQRDRSPWSLGNKNSVAVCTRGHVSALPSGTRHVIFRAGEQTDHRQIEVASLSLDLSRETALQA